MSEPVLIDPHPGLSGGAFGDRSWQLTVGRSVRRVQPSDLEALRRWRNTQQEVLRQQAPLTSANQTAWFETRVEPSYQVPRPAEILVVVEEAGEPVSYGGLTNIEWMSHRAELSFLTATERAANATTYENDLSQFLSWMKHFTFVELGLRRVFAETWAGRRQHIEILEAAGFVLEGRMRNHVIKAGVVQDALLHGLIVEDLEIP